MALDKKVARETKERHNYAARSRTGRGFADDLGRARVVWPLEDRCVLRAATRRGGENVA